MRRFDLCAAVTVSCYTTVYAESLEEAIELSKEREAELSFIGSGNDDREVWLVDDVDGTPFDIAEA